MIYFLFGLILLAVLLIFGARGFVQANPADLARKVRTLGGVAFYAGVFLVTVAVFTGLAGRIGLAIPVFIFGLSLIGASRLGGGYNPEKDHRTSVSGSNGDGGNGAGP